LNLQCNAIALPLSLFSRGVKCNKRISKGMVRKSTLGANILFFSSKAINKK
jgi:hypothetical protein